MPTSFSPCHRRYHLRLLPVSAPVGRACTIWSFPPPFLGGAPVASGAPPPCWCGVEELVRRRGTGAVSRNWCGVEELVRCRGTAAAWRRARPYVRSGRVDPDRGPRCDSFPHQLVVPAPFTRRRTGCIGCGDALVVRRRGTGAPSRNWCGADELGRRRGTGATTASARTVDPRCDSFPAPVGRSRPLFSAAHRLHRVRGRPSGAGPTNWCGAEQLVRGRPEGGAAGACQGSRATRFSTRVVCTSLLLSSLIRVTAYAPAPSGRVVMPS